MKTCQRMKILQSNGLLCSRHTDTTDKRIVVETRSYIGERTCKNSPSVSDDETINAGDQT